MGDLAAAPGVASMPAANAEQPEVVQWASRMMATLLLARAAGYVGTLLTVVPQQPAFAAAQEDAAANEDAAKDGAAREDASGKADATAPAAEQAAPPQPSEGAAAAEQQADAAGADAAAAAEDTAAELAGDRAQHEECSNTPKQHWAPAPP